MSNTPERKAVWPLLLILALIWGSSFILMKRGLFHDGAPVLSPWQMASARLFIAWLALLPLLVKYIGHFKKHWLALMGTGVLGNGLPAFFYATAQTRIDSSLSGMLNSLTPLFTFLAGVILFHTKWRLGQVIGILIGMVGAVGLIALDPGTNSLSWNAFAMLPVLGTMCYGLSGNIVKHHLYSLPAPATAVLALTFVGPIGAIGCIVTDLPHTLSTHPHGWSSLGYVAVLAVMSSAFSLVLWNALLQRTTAVTASTVTYLMPVVAIGWGLLDGEAISWGQMGMIAVVLSGVYLVNAVRYRPLGD
jgi:drug/metabolite transporter (DMT)-like permease